MTPTAELLKLITLQDLQVQEIKQHLVKIEQFVDQQQKQIQNLITANRNLVTRLNRLDKLQRDDHQGMW
ncbi:MAG: hypothetical protein EO766_12285 [Hydrotalea sp. AMD]|uniref:hypothetical protein n=1 Tax=Hydrotalea sp. AMD TaxID=2501297 RepID=UPI001026DC12|nr:hypothetical protein [Hydrotalea sp. AMD]RWZ87296.1 MAG: hypothetical protein EO766_12285 [Hydrotalea sp. AMD]